MCKRIEVNEMRINEMIVPLAGKKPPNYRMLTYLRL
jgi:hypothetical protein